MVYLEIVHFLKSNDILCEKIKLTLKNESMWRKIGWALIIFGLIGAPTGFGLIFLVIGIIMVIEV